jgi:hypothetical protein
VTAGQGMRLVFLVNALGCLLATAVLVFLPSLIPAAIGIAIAPDQYMIPRLLGASELAIAILCMAAVLRPSREICLACVSVLVVFHAASIAVGAMELAAHRNIVVEINIALRAVIVLMLLWLAGRPSAMG